MFNEAEVKLDAIEDIKESTPIQAKKKPVRQKLPKDPEREVIIHDLREDEKTVITAANHYTKWVDRALKNLSLFSQKLKSLNMTGSNKVAGGVKKKVLALRSKVLLCRQVQFLTDLRRLHY